jgi:hypothetical protein
MSESAELARALRVLRQVFGHIEVIYDHTRAETFTIAWGRRTVLDDKAIASGRRRSKNLAEYRDAQRATRRTT